MQIFNYIAFPRLHAPGKNKRRKKKKFFFFFFLLSHLLKLKTLKLDRKVQNDFEARSRRSLLPSYVHTLIRTFNSF